MICAALATLVVLQALIIWRQRVWLEMARQDSDRWRGLCREWRALHEKNAPPPPPLRSDHGREIREGGAKPQNIDPPTRDSGGLQKRGL